MPYAPSRPISEASKITRTEKVNLRPPNELQQPSKKLSIGKCIPIRVLACQFSCVGYHKSAEKTSSGTTLCPPPGTLRTGFVSLPLKTPSYKTLRDFRCFFFATGRLIPAPGVTIDTAPGSGWKQHLPLGSSTRLSSVSYFQRYVHGIAVRSHVSLGYCTNQVANLHAAICRYSETGTESGMQQRADGVGFLLRSVMIFFLIPLG